MGFLEVGRSLAVPVPVRAMEGLVQELLVAGEEKGEIPAVVELDGGLQ